MFFCVKQCHSFFSPRVALLDKTHNIVMLFTESVGTFRSKQLDQMSKAFTLVALNERRTVKAEELWLKVVMSEHDVNAVDCTR